MNQNSKGNDPDCYYEYHHGSGRHILVQGDPNDNRPRYSMACILHNGADCVIFLFVIGFLGGSFYLAYYLYNNYGDGCN